MQPATVGRPHADATDVRRLTIPGVNNTPGELWLITQIQQMQNQIRALQQQQNSSVADNNLKVRIQQGLLPDGSYGTRYLDAAGNERARIGQQSNGDYGLGVTDPSGNFAEMLPLQTRGVTTLETTTSTSWTDLATVGPSVTANIGATGNALIIVTAGIHINTTGVTGSLGVSIDGASPVSPVAGFGLNAATGAATVTGSFVKTGLSAGSHTFKIQYENSGAIVVGYDVRSLIVWPI